LTVSPVTMAGLAPIMIDFFSKLEVSGW